MHSLCRVRWASVAVSSLGKGLDSAGSALLQDMWPEMCLRVSGAVVPVTGQAPGRRGHGSNPLFYRHSTSAGLSFLPPQKFRPSKLKMTFVEGAMTLQCDYVSFHGDNRRMALGTGEEMEASGSGRSCGNKVKEGRAYTLTHNDITGQLNMAIGPSINIAQVDSWYTRLFRDEVTAEWLRQEHPREHLVEGPEHLSKNSLRGLTLHVYIHVSGDGPEILAPAPIRDFIFRRELPLVLSAFRYGDRKWVEDCAERLAAPVLVHFMSADEKYDRTEVWGTVGMIGTESLHTVGTPSSSVESTVQSRGASENLQGGGWVDFQISPEVAPAVAESSTEGQHLIL